MPRTEEERLALQGAVDSALASGHMSKAWPNNTIWLGGHWNNVSSQWEWDDGSQVAGVNWAPGQPSARAHQWTEPWLCMVSEGVVHDSNPPYSFGVICEVQGGFLQRKMLELDSDQSDVTWVRGRSAASCDEACADHGGCSEAAEAWPSNRERFEAVLARGAFPACLLSEGGRPYDPSATELSCTWRGAEPAAGRCAARGPPGTERFCPCRGRRMALPPIWA